jgi:hypothetical protein
MAQTRPRPLPPARRCPLLSFAGGDSGKADPERGRLAAQRFGAGWFVLGHIIEAGGRLQVSATISDGPTAAA